MKNRLGTVVALLVLGAVVGFGSYFSIDRYYESHGRTSEAEAAQFAADAQERKVIPVEFEVLAPAETPGDQPLYLSGSEPALGNWDAAGIPLVRGPDAKYRATVQVTQGIEYSYKLTRGTWGTVEKGPRGEEIENRSLKCDQPQVVQAVVATWVDGGKAIPGRITTAGDIRLHKKFQSRILGNERTIVVYLPPGYEHSADARYPVLYMQDGQNLFDEGTSYAGVEWKLDEAAQMLISEGKIKPIIIVGIYNTPDRTAEFTPPPWGRAGLYGRFIVEELKPFVDRTYRTLPDRANAAIGGSSLGALATLFIAKANKDVFSQIAILTPFLRIDGKPVVDSPVDVGALKNTRVWLDMGPSPAKNYPGDDPLGDARGLVKQFDAAGLKRDVDYRYVEVPDGEHSESSWQLRAPQVLMFLFAAEQAPTTGPS